MSDKICYCYDYAEVDIREDVRSHQGRSPILEKLLAEKQKGACRCAVMHPEGR
jgi:hypothetical protein